MCSAKEIETESHGGPVEPLEVVHEQEHPTLLGETPMRAFTDSEQRRPRVSILLFVDQRAQARSLNPGVRKRAQEIRRTRAGGGGPMSPGGYFGRALTVDLGTGAAQTVPLAEHVLRATEASDAVNV